MKELFAATSTNGNYGIALVGPEGTTFPAEGSIKHLGKVAGMATYEFTPGETETWIYVGGDVQVRGGATVVASEDLQSSRFASILLLGPEAIIETYGYKGRGTCIEAYVRGIRTDIPATVLAALGLIEAEGEIIAIAPPPVLQGAMALAFAKLKNKEESK